MAVTRPQVRQAALDEDFVGGMYGTATNGTDGKLTDTTLLQVGGNSVSEHALKRLKRREEEVPYTSQSFVGRVRLVPFFSMLSVYRDVPVRQLI